MNIYGLNIDKQKSSDIGGNVNVEDSLGGIVGSSIGKGTKNSKPLP